MIYHTHAFARAGLIGNPSDGYHGKTIAVICRNFSARVTCYEAPRITLRRRLPDLEFASIDALVEDVRLRGYYGGERLIKAAVKRFVDYCREQGHELGDRKFALEFETDVPIRVGLAGSSAIVTATLRALCAFFQVDVPTPVMPNLILSVELDELGIGAGLQDRVAQTYEGAVYMDFDKAYMAEHGYGRYRSLDATKLPPLFVAYHDNLAEGTEITHNDLRSRYNRGEPAVLDAITRWAELAERAHELIEADRGSEIGPLMDENFDLRASLIPISEGNRKLVEIGRDQGASVKFAGSGGAVIGCYDGDPERLERVSAAYAEFGARTFVPVMTEDGTTDEHG